MTAGTTADGPHVLGPVEAVRLLWGLTRESRVDHLGRVAERYPAGALLVTPLNRMLVTSTPTATKHVLVTHHARYRKGLGQAQARQIIGDGLLTTEGESWRAQRKDVNPLLRSAAVEPHHAAIDALARASVDEIDADSWYREDPAVRLARYTLECLSLTMGFRAPDAARIHDAFDAVQDEALFRSVVQGTVPLWARRRDSDRIHQALRILATATASSLDGAGRTESWATTEGMTSLFLAGYETTASTLSWAVRNLAARPHLQARIRAEAVDVEASDTTSKVGQLRLTAAVFKETLRLRPPVWLISRRATEPDVVDGVRLRPGDEVLVLPSVAARRGWDDPDDFRPDRFLGTATGPALWFGAGPRACPGGSLAQAEAVCWLAAACRRLEFRLHAGTAVAPRARMSQIPAQDLRRLVDVRPIDRHADQSLTTAGTTRGHDTAKNVLGNVR